MHDRFRFLISTRWLGLTAFALVAVVVCALLATWQQGRATERSAANDRIEAGADATPVPLDEALPADSALDDDERWRVVEVTGEFDTDNEVAVRARPQGGEIGVEIITPLNLADGTTVLINRGWLSPDDAADPAAAPPVPDGEVTVIGRLYESEPARGEVSRGDDWWESRVISISQLDDNVPGDLRAGYVGDLEAAAPFQVQSPPSYRAWQNYSYAVQWWLFAAMIPVGYVVLVRRELRATPGGAAKSRSIHDELAED